jgi:SAM-dependent methyltransferase
MLGLRSLPAEYAAWNKRWGAPFGFPFAQELLQQTNTSLEIAARLAGPFAFQANNSTREFEYPWAYHQIDHSAPRDIIDVGGGVTGMQFVLSLLGHRVHTVDPGLASAAYGWGSRSFRHQDLNAAFGTSVGVYACHLEEADLPQRAFDYVVCISTIEHAPTPAVISLIDTSLQTLKPGGRLVATVDLFLNLTPFTTRQENEWGTNIDLGAVLKQVRSPFQMVLGRPEELYGFPEFSPARVLENLEKYYVGIYPCLSQCFVLEAL